MQSQSLAILCATVTMASWGIENALSKKYSGAIGPSKLMFYGGIVKVFMMLLALALFFKTATFDIKYMLISLAIICLGYCGYYFFLRGLQTGKLGLVSPVSSTWAIVAVLFGVIFLNDQLSHIQYVLVTLVVVGVMLLSLNPNDLDRSQVFSTKSGLHFALLTALFWGIALPLYSIPINILGAYLFVLLVESTVFVLSFVHARLMKKSIYLTTEELKENFIGILLIGLFGGIGSLFINIGFSTGHVGLVSTISTSVPAVSVIIGQVVYKEHLNKKQLFAIVLIITGIIMLSYLSN